LEKLLGEVTEEHPVDVDLQTFWGQNGETAAKAYFRFKDNAATFTEY
jgi:hypothetical protein